ncbi:MAG: hypothetical protein R3F30_12120 [Planctomycetota bacterium]
MLALSLCALLQVTAPPEGPRIPTIGRCLTAAGEPWAGAEVRLVTRQLVADHGAGWQDEVVATTRDDGRFSVKLLEGRIYLGWVLQPLPDDAGLVRASDVVGLLLPGSAIELREDRVNSVVRLELPGTDAWADQGPLRYRAVVGAGDECWIGAVEVVDGELRLPAVGGEGIVIEVLDRLGRVVTTRWLELARDAERKPLPLLPPCRVLVRVRGQVDGELRALAGARVLLWVYSHWSELGRTAEDGGLELWLQADPKGPGPVEARLLVLADGHAECLVPLPVPRRMVAAKEDERTEELLRVTVLPDAGPSLRGVVLGEDGEPMAGAPLLLRSWLYATVVPTNHNSSVYVPRVHRTGPDGRFVVPVPPLVGDNGQDVLCLSLVGRLEEPLCFPVLSQVGDVAELRVDRSRQTRTRIEVRDDEGRVPPALCHVLPAGNRNFRLDPICHSMGPRGRLELYLPELPLRVVCESARSYDDAQLPIGAEGPRAVALELGQGVRVSGRLLYPDDSPVPGATLWWQRNDRRVAGIGASQQLDISGDLRLNRVAVAADGSFALWVPGPGTFVIPMSQSWKGGGRFEGGLKRIQVGTEPITDLVLRVKR